MLSNVRFNQDMKNQPFYKRFVFAFCGIRTAFRSEKSFRTQIFFASVTLLVLIVLRPHPIWWGLLSLTVASVLAAELINTSLEAAIDRVHPQQHPMIAKAKDCAAGAVLVMSLASLLVAVAMIYDVYIEKSQIFFN